MLIVDHDEFIDAYVINIIDTIINLNLLNPIAPNVLEISAEIREAIDQQKAASRARK